MNLPFWIWPALVLAFLLGAIATAWFVNRRKGKKALVNPDYFKGLNFLLNEEPDKAIEVFIKALEVDSETVELHLALGGLFRRKGQVDRATRIHQNLIARPNFFAASAATAAKILDCVSLPPKAPPIRRTFTVTALDGTSST